MVVQRIRSVPLFLQIVALFAVLMLVPAGHALYLEDFSVARTFLYASILTFFLVSLIGIAVSDRYAHRTQRLQGLLVSLFAAYTVLPAILALPFQEAVGTTSFLNAYLEMVSCLTTTGLVLFDDPSRLTASLHLWRALVGWMGGLIIWVAAMAVFAPLNLGGFEVSAQSNMDYETGNRGVTRGTDSSKRLRRAILHLAPIYFGLTVVLSILQMLLGEEPLIAATHAMSVMATSGISAVDGLNGASSGVGGEILIFLFLLFALSRETFTSDIGETQRQNVLADPEFRFGLLIVFLVPMLLILRHWYAAIEIDEESNLLALLSAWWGAFFTVLSFLSTAGFESAHWQSAQSWSGLGTPGLIFMGLAMVGGGVATTAGGVKLLRVYALYLQGLREMDHMLHPSAVVKTRASSGRIRRQGAVIAWVFFMLFALSLMMVTLLLAMLGSSLEDAIVLAVATLSTTGPLAQSAAVTPIDLLALSGWTKGVLSAAMVLGRLETLVIIALISPNLWRN